MCLILLAVLLWISLWIYYNYYLINCLLVVSVVLWVCSTNRIIELETQELWRYPLSPQLHQPLLTIPLLYGRWSTSGSDRDNAHFFTATSNTIEGTGGKKEQTNKTNKILGVNSSAEGELCNTLCMCRLTLVWIPAKLPQSKWNADSSWLDLLYCCWTLSPADSPLCSGVHCRLPLSVSCRQLPSRAPFPANSLLASPSISGHGEISSPKPFVWFRTKTDKGIVCLAGRLHSVTEHHLTEILSNHLSQLIEKKW